jgi:hypothetical protein
MKKFKKLIINCLILLFVSELGLLIGETYIYTKYDYCRLNINGRIVAKVDNTINFSGWASK